MYVLMLVFSELTVLVFLLYRVLFCAAFARMVHLRFEATVDQCVRYKCFYCNVCIAAVIFMIDLFVRWT